MLGTHKVIQIRIENCTKKKKNNREKIRSKKKKLYLYTKIY